MHAAKKKESAPAEAKKQGGAKEKKPESSVSHVNPLWLQLATGFETPEEAYAGDSSLCVQAQLKVDAFNEKYEQEADQASLQTETSVNAPAAKPEDMQAEQCENESEHETKATTVIESTTNEAQRKAKPWGAAETMAAPEPGCTPSPQKKGPSGPERIMGTPALATPPLVESTRIDHIQPIRYQAGKQQGREGKGKVAFPPSLAELHGPRGKTTFPLEASILMDSTTVETGPALLKKVRAAEASGTDIALLPATGGKPTEVTLRERGAVHASEAAGAEVSEAGSSYEGRAEQEPGETGEPVNGVASRETIAGPVEQNSAAEMRNGGEEVTMATETLGENQQRTDVADLPSSSDFPLASDAQRYLVEIDALATESSSDVRADATAKRDQIRANFAARRAAVSAFIVGNLQAVTDFIDAKIGAASAWLLSKAAALMGVVASVVNGAVRMAMTIGGAIHRGIATLVSLVVGSVGGIARSIRSVARSISIPDIPGIGGIARAVTAAIDRVVGVVEGSLRNVQNLISQAVSDTLAMINDFIARVVSGTLNIANRLFMKVARAVTYIGRQLGLAKNWILDTARRVEARTHALLNRIERASLRRIDVAERHAVRDIEENRGVARRNILQILEFCYASGDYSEDEATHGSLDVVDNTNETETFENAAREAMVAAVAQQQTRNTKVVNTFAKMSIGLVAMAIGSANVTAETIFTNISRVFDKVMASLRQTIAQMLGSMAGIFMQISAGIIGLINVLAEKLSPIVDVVIGILRLPVDALINRGRAIVRQVGSFIYNSVSRLVRWLTGTGGSGGGFDTGSLTSEFDAFSPSQLRLAVGMASPLVGVLVLFGGAVVITGEAILTLLSWIAIIGIIIGVAILIWFLIIKPLLARVRARPHARPRARPRTRPRVRRHPRRRRRRRRRRPLWWNAGITRSTVVPSGGMPGTLDIRIPRGQWPASAPLSGHHPWPEYVGGPHIQPLMSVRQMVHSRYIHTNAGIHGAAKLAARAMGYTISTHLTDPRNQAFILHLRNNPADRTAFMGALVGFHYSLNTMPGCYPTIPPQAYGRGIVYSYLLI